MKHEFDQAINTPTEDKLGNNMFAYYLAKGILDIEKIPKSFVIGLYGQWGEGKTSIINMMSQYLKHLPDNPDAEIEDINELIKTDENLKCKRIKIFTNIGYFILLIAIVSLMAYFSFKLFIFSFSKWHYYIIWSCLATVVSLYFFFEKLTVPIHKLSLEEIKILAPFKKIYHHFKPKKDKHPLLIEFHPWNYKNSETILEHFFKTLVEKIDASNNNCFINLPELIKQYSKLILNLDLSPFEKIFLNPKSIDIKEKIEKELRNCNHSKIIIVIDDMDRLFPKEILTIFKTVKMIADFPNVVYVLAFDKARVINLLKKQIDAEDYIKKIVQIEKTIPPIDEEILKNIFLKNIKTTVENISDDEIKSIETMYDCALKDIYIKNLRDINRFFNSFDFTYSAYKDEKINIQNLVGIVATEVFEAQLYKYIRENKYIFCGSAVGIYKNKKGTIYTSSKGKIQKCFLEFINEVKDFKNINILIMLFPELFKKIKQAEEGPYNANDTGNEKHLPEIKDFMEMLKSKPMELFELEEKYRSISDLNFFDNYFRVNFNKRTLSAAENKVLLDKFDDTESFKRELYTLFDENPNKVSDFLKGWESFYNLNFRTKENTLKYIKNLISLDRQDVISFLNQENRCYYLIANIIRSFNKGNPKTTIKIDEIYKIIESQIKYLQTNCFTFLFLICRLEDNFFDGLWQSDPQKQLILNKCRELIKKNIAVEAILSDERAIDCIDYLYSVLEGKEFADLFIENILQDGQEENLLNFLITAGYDVTSIDKIFRSAAKKASKLKNKLLEIRYSKKFEEMRSKDKYNFVDDLGDKKHIITMVLNFFKIDLKKLQQKIANKIQNGKKMEDILKLIKRIFGKYFNYEIEFIKEIEYEDVKRNFIKQIKDIEQKIASRSDLLDEYGEILDRLTMD